MDALVGHAESRAPGLRAASMKPLPGRRRTGRGRRCRAPAAAGGGRRGGACERDPMTSYRRPPRCSTSWPISSRRTRSRCLRGAQDRRPRRRAAAGPRAAPGRASTPTPARDQHHPVGLARVLGEGAVGPFDGHARARARCRASAELWSPTSLTVIRISLPPGSADSEYGCPPPPHAAHRESGSSGTARRRPAAGRGRWPRTTTDTTPGASCSTRDHLEPVGEAAHDRQADAVARPRRRRSAARG